MSLSEVLSYNTEHLVDAAAHWQGLADQREEVFAGVRNDALTLPWEGQAADALHQRTGADYNTAMDSAGNLRQAAMMAKDGASMLDQLHFNDPGPVHAAGQDSRRSRCAARPIHKR